MGIWGAIDLRLQLRSRRCFVALLLFSGSVLLWPLAGRRDGGTSEHPSWPLQSGPFGCTTCLLGGANAQVVGIDLGSEFIKAAIVAPGKRLEILLSSSSSRKFLNAVSFAEKDRSALSEEADAQSHKIPERVFCFSNLFLGLSAQQIGPPRAPTPQDQAADQSCSDGFCHSCRGLWPVVPHSDLWPGGLSKLYYPYEVFESPGRGSVLFKVRDDLLLPPESLVAAILSSIRQAAAASALLPASTALGTVVAVPCRYSQRQREALRDALEIAGFKVLGFVTHGAAAGVQYALDAHEAFEAANKMILNVGSVSVDASVLSFQLGSPSKSQDANSSSSSSSSKQQQVPVVSMLSCSSSSSGGGRSVDLLLADSLRKSFEEKHGVSLAAFPRALKKIEKQAAIAKKVLSASRMTFFKAEGLHQGKDFATKVQRQHLEELLDASGLLKKLQETADASLQAPALLARPQDFPIDAVELIGGAWRVPRVLQHIQNWGGGPGAASSDPKKVQTHLNGDEAVATGAAFIAASSTAAFRVRSLQFADGVPFLYALRFSGVGADEKDGQEALVEAQDQQQQDSGKTHVLVAPFKKLGGSKKVSVRCRKDFVVQLLEDDQVICTYAISGVQTAHTQHRKGLDEQQTPAEAEPAEAPKAELLFTIDATGIIELTNATLHFESATSETLSSSSSSSSSSSTEGPAGGASGDGDGASASVSSSSSTEESVTSSTVTTKQSVKQFSYPLQFSTVKSLPLPLTTEQKDQLRRLLQDQETLDAARRALGEALNSLETFIYSARSLVSEGTLDLVTEAAFREQLKQELELNEEWAYGGATAPIDLPAVQDRIQRLKDLVEPAQLRAKEAQARPGLTEKTDKLFQDVEKRLGQYPESRPWIPDNKIAAVRSLLADLLAWWTSKRQEQESRSPLLQPVFTEAQVLLKLKDLQQRLRFLEQIPKPTTTTTTTVTTTKSSNNVGDATGGEPSSQVVSEEEGVLSGSNDWAGLFSSPVASDVSERKGDEKTTGGDTGEPAGSPSPAEPQVKGQPQPGGADVASEGDPEKDEL